MIKKSIQWLVDISSKNGKWARTVKVAIFLIGISPVLLVSYLGYYNTKTQATNLTLSRRQTLAHVASIVIKEKLDRIVDFGKALAQNPRFEELVRAGKWEDAIALLEHTPKHFSYVDNAVIFNPQGILMAITPSIPEVIGQDFSYRDYYKGVSKDWQPYVSEVFKRAAEPHYNVVAVAIPITSDNGTTQDQKITGILLLTIKLDTVLQWAREVNVGQDGFVYFIDQRGHVAGHPTFSSYDNIVDFSQIPAVAKALTGQKGIEIAYQDTEEEEMVLAYEPVAPYGWGVIVQQPSRTFFAVITTALWQLFIIDSIVVFVAGFLFYVILRFVETINMYRQKEKVFLESVGDGLVGIDRSWNITLWNKAATVLTGFTPQEAIGQPLRSIMKFVYEKNREENIRFIEDTMLLGKTHFMENHTLLTQKNGQEIPVGDSASPVFDQKGNVTGAIIIFRDVSKDHEIQKAREEFSSLATHQLRAPITVIKEYSDLLTSGEFPLTVKEKKQAIGVIHNSAQSLGDLVNAMLDVSRVEADSFVITPEPVYLPDIAKKTIKELSLEFTERKIKLEEKYDDALPSISADPKLVEVILKNLLSNAAKYAPLSGKVTLSIASKAPDILIAVSDNGLGIPKNQQDKLFGKFFRADNVISHKIKGTGLGLYIVKSIVEQSGGKIWFQSEENKGATFYVSIPLSGMRKKNSMKGLL